MQGGLLDRHSTGRSFYTGIGVSLIMMRRAVVYACKKLWFILMIIYDTD